MKISIIGHTGSGKSTLAGRISEKFAITHIHIDRFWFAAGGNKLPLGESSERDAVRQHIEEQVHQAIRAESWVSDGFYPHVQSIIADAADQIVYIDIPLWRRITNHLERILRRSERHPEVTLWDDIAYFPDIVRRHLRTEPKLQKFLAEHEGRIITLRSRKEVRNYLNSLTREAPVI